MAMRSRDRPRSPVSRNSITKSQAWSLDSRVVMWRAAVPREALAVPLTSASRRRAARGRAEPGSQLSRSQTAWVLSPNRDQSSGYICWHSKVMSSLKVLMFGFFLKNKPEQVLFLLYLLVPEPWHHMSTVFPRCPPQLQNGYKHWFWTKAEFFTWAYEPNH